MNKWKANYSDGTFLSQTSEDGSENRYEDIDRSKLVSFELLKGESILFRLFLKRDQRLIFRRRNFLDINGNLKSRQYLIGYQYNDASGKNHKVLTYIDEFTGLVEIDDDRNDLIIHPEEE